MMTAVRLRWLGVTRKQLLHNLVADRVHVWFSCWAAPGATVRPAVETLLSDRDEVHAFGPDWYRIESPSGCTYVNCSRRSLEALGGSLARAPISDDCGIAVGIARRSVADLCAMFHSTGVPSELKQLDGSPADSDISTRFGAIGFRTQIGSLEFEMYFNSHLCDALAPIARVQRSPVVARRVAVMPLSATLSAVLDLGATSVAAWIALRPGDVVKTSTSVSARVNVSSQSGGNAFFGELVTQKGKRAIRIERNNQRQEIKR